MLSPLSLVRTEAVPAAAIRLTVSRDQIQEVMCPAITEVIDAVVAQGIGPAGPLYTHHFRVDPDRFDFEVAVPVSGPLQPVGRVVSTETPAADRVARVIYTGPYEGLEAAWGDFMGLIGEAGHQPGPNAWESYLTDPATTPNPADHRTELNRPIR